MPIFLARCASSLYEQKYMEFLLKHYSELHMPYPFSVALSYLSSPILLKGERFLAIHKESDTAVAAFSFIYGTGDKNYENTDIIQFQVAYITDSYRSSTLFLRMMQYMLNYLCSQTEQVREVRFWTSNHSAIHNLLCKRLDITPATHDTVYGRLDEYQIALSSFKHYASQFKQEQYF